MAETFKRQAVTSTENIWVLVDTTSPIGTIDPTPDDVFMAFMAPGNEPTDPDWKAAAWEVANATTNRPLYYAVCLVGPLNGGVALSVGTYDVWVKVPVNPEVPIVLARGALEIF